MLDLLHLVHQPPNSRMPIRLNQGFRTNLAWWHEFLSAWKGMSFLCPPGHRLSVIMTSNASGSWGCGALCNQHWFQVQWDHMSQSLTIAEKELIPIILGCAAWGGNWSEIRSSAGATTKLLWRASDPTQEGTRAIYI